MEIKTTIRILGFTQFFKQTAIILNTTVSGFVSNVIKLQARLRLNFYRAGLNILGSIKALVQSRDVPISI